MAKDSLTSNPAESLSSSVSSAAKTTFCVIVRTRNNITSRKPRAM